MEKCVLKFHVCKQLAVFEQTGKIVRGQYYMNFGQATKVGILINFFFLKLLCRNAAYLPFCAARDGLYMLYFLTGSFLVCEPKHIFFCKPVCYARRCVSVLAAQNGKCYIVRWLAFSQYQLVKVIFLLHACHAFRAAESGIG